MRYRILIGHALIVTYPPNSTVPFASKFRRAIFACSLCAALAAPLPVTAAAVVQCSDGVYREAPCAGATPQQPPAPRAATGVQPDPQHAGCTWTFNGVTIDQACRGDMNIALGQEEQRALRSGKVKYCVAEQAAPPELGKGTAGDLVALARQAEQIRSFRQQKSGRDIRRYCR